MMQGNRRLQSQRMAKNPSIRDQRRNNGHVRAQAPDPNAFLAQNQPKRPPDYQQLQDGEDNLMTRLDRIRQQKPGQAVGAAATDRSRPSRAGQAGVEKELGEMPLQEGVLPLPQLADASRANAQLMRLMATQRARLRAARMGAK